MKLSSQGKQPVEAKHKQDPDTSIQKTDDTGVKNGHAKNEPGEERDNPKRNDKPKNM